MVRRINLVPAGERRRTQSDIGMLVLVALAILVLGGIAFSYFHYNNVLSDKDAQLADLQSKTQKVEAELATLVQFETLQNQMNQAELLVQRVYAGRTLVSEVLGDISLVVPNEVWFQSLSVSAPDVTAAVTAKAGETSGSQAAAGAVTAAIGQFSVSGSTYGFEQVAELMVRLQQVPSFTNVVLGSINPGAANSDPAKKVKAFTMSASVTNTQLLDTPLPLTQVEVSP